MDYTKKHVRLKEIITAHNRLAIAFSGGLDSIVLAKLSIETLGKDNVLGIIAKGNLLPANQYKNARKIADIIGLNLLTISTNELSIEEIVENTPGRCYFCKKYLMQTIVNSARQNSFDTIICGNNVDDKGDFRPGLKATSELGIESPFMEADFGKQEIIRLAKDLGLEDINTFPTTCLASRIPYYQKITKKKLIQIEKAEEYISKLGISYLRVRHHGEIARIEVESADFNNIIKNQSLISTRLKGLGFKFVTLDLEGIKSGRLNEALSDEEKAAY